MKRAFVAGVAGAIALSLGACASQGPRGPAEEVIDRVLAKAPGKAQPSTIVSTEIAFARMAKENGQWTAFRAFAAPSAMLHGRNGAMSADAFLTGLSDPEQAVQWAPRTIAMSCDGGLAVSMGRFRDPDGVVGNFVTVWERQPDDTYKWIYDAGGPDVPQPPPRKDFEDGDIVVTALDTVQGLVATCPRAGEPTPPPPPIPVGEGGASAAQISSDGTLRWRWEHREGGIKYVTADYYFDGEWVTAIEESLASAGEG